MKKAALHNLGCKVNAYETESMQEMLESAGYEIVDFHDQADVYVVNTCSVTNIADRKSRQMIHQAKKRNPNAIVVAAGCYVQTSPEQAMDDDAIDILIGNNQKYRLLEFLNEYETTNKKVCRLLDISHDKNYEAISLDRTAEHTRAFVKVQDGCNQFCTYCIIPYARGRVRSRNLQDVMTEITTLSQHGYKEVVLTGIHLSSYGIDNNSSLIELIEAVSTIPGVERIRLGSLEPGIITEEFVNRLKAVKQICPHFHLSLQSGCNETLKRMNRRYTAEEFKEKCNLLRKTFEHPAFTTDVIVGFPGETEREFAATRDFLQEIDFYEVHLFKYSKRQNTPAAVMPDQLTEKQKADRSHILSNDLKENKKRFMEYYIGREVTILVEESEEIEGKEFFVGYTKEYVKLAIPSIACKGQVNCFVTVVPSEFITEDMMGIV